jgi:hypothetical protein
MAPTLKSTITGSHGGTVLSSATYADPVTVASGASVYGSGKGTNGLDAATNWTVQNYGMIGSQYDAGIRLNDGGVVENEIGGAISGSTIGIYITNGAGTVENEGGISGNFAAIDIGGPGKVENSGSIGGSYYGVKLTDGGYVSNASGGTIGGSSSDGVNIGGDTGTVVNQGAISGFFGVKLTDGGIVTNAVTGNITSNGRYGVLIGGSAGTVENSGAITGYSGYYGFYDSVYLGGNVSNRLILDAGAIFTGEAVARAGAANTIELTSSASAGTLTGLGSEYVGFQHLDIDAGAAWTVTGAEAGFNGVTIDFNTSDTLDITDLAYQTGEKGAVFNRTSYLLTIYNGGSPETIQFSGAYAGLYFHATSDGGDGTDITLSDSPACYCRGTLIETSRGKVAVEELTVGDLLVTLSGELRPLKWIGRRSYAGWLAAGNPDVQPVLFKAGSLADNVPSRDLMVSPEHAMFLDGALIPARHLVNGVSIIQTSGLEEIHYFHLELEEHAVIFAEDAASETYVDDGNRGMFHNVYDYYAEFPDAPRGRDADYCAPRIEDGFELDAVQRALNARAHRLRPDGTAAPAPELRGHLDRVTRILVEGWAEGPDPLAILDNGAIIGRVFPDANHRFRFTMPTGFWTEIRHQIEVRREGDWTPLPGSGLALEPEALAA